MYQSEMKEGFIKDYMRSRVIARTSLYSLFRKTEPFEEDKNKDCSYFDQDEVLSMYTNFRAKSIYVLLNYNTILKAYCAWRRYYHKEKVSESYDNINIELLKPCVPKDSNNVAIIAFILSLRFRITTGFDVSPSTPEFQLQLESVPSLLFSPLARLCFFW